MAALACAALALPAGALVSHSTASAASLAVSAAPLQLWHAVVSIDLPPLAKEAEDAAVDAVEERPDEASTDEDHSTGQSPSPPPAAETEADPPGGGASPAPARPSGHPAAAPVPAPPARVPERPGVEEEASADRESGGTARTPEDTAPPAG